MNRKRQRPSIPVRKNPVLFLPVDVQKISVGKGFMLGAGNREARNVLERLLANGALLVGSNFAFHPPDLRLNLVEKIIEVFRKTKAHSMSRNRPGGK